MDKKELEKNITELEMKREKLMNLRSKYEEDLKALKFLIGDLNDSLLVCDNSLKELNEKYKKFDFGRYEVKNGLVGLNRDLIIHLILLSLNDEKVRSIFGIGFETFEWKSSEYFHWIRCKAYKPKYAHNSFGGFSLDGTDQLNVSFFGRGNKSLFFDRTITEGIWQMRMQFSHFGNDHFFVGAANTAYVRDYLTHFIGSSYESAALELGTLASFVRHKRSWFCLPESTCLAHDGCVVAVQVDIAMHTLDFYLDGVQVPAVVTNIPGKIQLGFSAMNNLHVKFVLMSRMEQKIRLTSSVKGVCEWK